MRNAQKYFSSFMDGVRYKAFFILSILLGIYNDVYLRRFSNTWIFSRNLFSMIFAAIMGGRIEMSRNIFLRGIFGFFASYFFSRSLDVLSVREITVYYYFLPIFDIILSPQGKRTIPILCLLILGFFLETWNLDIILACIFWSLSDFLIRSYKGSVMNNIFTFHFINLIFSYHQPLEWKIFPVSISDLFIQILLFSAFRNVSFESLFPLRLVDIFITQKYLS